MKMRFGWLLGLMFVATALQAKMPYPMEAQQVAPDVYAIITPTRDLPNPQNKGWNSNSAFVVTQTGVLLFDTGSSTTIGQSLRQTIASVTNKPVRWVINSHAHGDHWLGNAAFADSVEAIYASQEVINRIQADGKNWITNFNRMTNGATGESAIVLPNKAIDEHTELTLGGVRFIVFPSNNSHSPGDLILWMPDAKVLISGDVIYSNRMPSTNASNLRQWMQTLSELQQLQPTVVIPGHGKVTDISGITRLHELFSTLWQAVEAGYKAGKSDFEMVSDVSKALAGFSKDYPGLDEKLKRDISHVYLQVEADSF